MPLRALLLRVQRPQAAPNHPAGATPLAALQGLESATGKGYEAPVRVTQQRLLVLDLDELKYLWYGFGAYPNSDIATLQDKEAVSAALVAAGIQYNDLANKEQMRAILRAEGLRASGSRDVLVARLIDSQQMMGAMNSAKKVGIAGALLLVYSCEIAESRQWPGNPVASN